MDRVTIAQAAFEMSNAPGSITTLNGSSTSTSAAPVVTDDIASGAAAEFTKLDG
jgi:hypothetical protein